MDLVTSYALVWLQHTPEFGSVAGKIEQLLRAAEKNAALDDVEAYGATDIDGDEVIALTKADRQKLWGLIQDFSDATYRDDGEAMDAAKRQIVSIIGEDE